MNERSGFEGTYRSVDSKKRQMEVLDRLKAGHTEKQIADDLGISRFSVQQIAEQLRADGDVPAAPDSA